MKRYYIKKGICRALAIGIEPQNTGTTEADYLAGKLIEVSEQQAAFYKEHTTASFGEIMSMEISMQKQYKDLVISKIRERYSIDDEFAIHRKQNVEVNEFALYNAFCEQCKSEAKQELGMVARE
jgi:hypothetical protein